LKDSNSIVALSVSISARISPSATASPFFQPGCNGSFGHRMLKRGIVITTTPFGKEVATEDDSL
jgi:hypothetical protein